MKLKVETLRRALMLLENYAEGRICMPADEREELVFTIRQLGKFLDSLEVGLL